MNTKKKVAAGVVIACLLIAGEADAAGTPEDAVLGTWLVPQGDAKVTIYRCDGEYCGRISWLETPDDLDTKNPDESKRARRLLGLDILRGFRFDDGVWKGGKIYDPDTGNTYSCKMWLEGTDELKVKGYVLVSLFGRSEMWRRVE